MVSVWRRLNLLVVAVTATTIGGMQTAAACAIAVLGDSLTAAYGLETAQGFPAQLESALRAGGRDCRVIDAGVSGDTSAGGLARLDWVLADRPTHLIIELGANDMLRALPTDQLEQNLDAIIARSKAQGVAVLLAGMLAAPNLGEAYGTAFAKVYTDLADRHRIPLYPFFLDGVAGVAGLDIGDGLHPNARGIEIVVERILPTVTGWLDTSAGAGADAG